METFPAHVVCGWIGNSEAIALKHYLQVTDDHFERAVRGDAEPNGEAGPTENGAQKGAQHAHAGSRREQHAVSHQRKIPGIAGACDFLRYSEHLFITHGALKHRKIPRKNRVFLKRPAHKATHLEPATKLTLT